MAISPASIKRCRMREKVSGWMPSCEAIRRLGTHSLDMAVAGLLLLAQVARHPAAGVAQGQGVDFVEALVQAHAEAAEQLQTGLGLLFQHAAIVRAVDADQAARLEGRCGHRVVAGATEQQGFGKALAGGDDLHQLFLAFRQHAGQGHLAFEQQVEAVRRIALMEQGGTGFQAQGGWPGSRPPGRGAPAAGRTDGAGVGDAWVAQSVSMVHLHVRHGRWGAVVGPIPLRRYLQGGSFTAPAAPDAAGCAAGCC